MNYILSENTKKDLDALLRESNVDLTRRARRLRPAAPSPGGGGEAYEGPFACTKKSDTVITVAAGYSALNTLQSFTEADVTVNASGVIYLEAVWGNGVYTVTAKFAANMPAVADNKIHALLASVTMANGAITGVMQMQYGIWYPNGRVL